MSTFTTGFEYEAIEHALDNAVTGINAMFGKIVGLLSNDSWVREIV